jgi:hypothetical protein
VDREIVFLRGRSNSKRVPREFINIKFNIYIYIFVIKKKEKIDNEGVINKTKVKEKENTIRFWKFRGNSNKHIGLPCSGNHVSSFECTSRLMRVV